MASKQVGLFVTCLVDLYRPNVGFASIKLLEAAGCTVVVPQNQTCCGQPAYNSGDNATTAAIARNTIEAFAGVDYIVAPSGSCAGMLRDHYPELLKEDHQWHNRANEFAKKCYELTSFLTDVMGFNDIDATYQGTVTYHDSCSGLRELGVKQQPRQLLSKTKALTLEEMDDTDVCCGFGGTFCVKYPEISTKMVTDKIALAQQTDADTLLGGDMGCLLNISGRLSRMGSDMRVYHVAEVLANMAEGPGIGQGQKDGADS
ncbi:MAG: (Fe-S)-binding protein [Gammaproteobacteria bacterium]|nr:(Fe-S)-binding protein [Gammaproteobacteria bacterium]